MIYCIDWYAMARNPENTNEAWMQNVSRRTFMQSGAVGAATLTLGLSAAQRVNAQTSDRVESLLDEMSLEEKIAQITGQDAFREDTGYIPPNERLNIDEIRMSDGPLGLRRGPQTAFPATISLASTFDRELVRSEGAAIARALSS